MDDWLLHPDQIKVGDFVCWNEEESEWWHFSSQIRVLQAQTVTEAHQILVDIEDWSKQGWAAGYIAYDAAAAFDPALEARRHPDCPLAVFTLFSGPPKRYRVLTHGALPNRPKWTPEIEGESYKRLFASIRDHLAEGDTYQANLTYRLRSNWSGDLRQLWALLATERTPVEASYFSCPSVEIGCLSPELFFDKSEDSIYSRPMKGTADGTSSATGLASSAKDRAENLMVVDMIRNDLGRIAETGSVSVPRLFEVRRHREVLQMTSTVSARTSATLPQVFEALFPCASIVGAPKVETMRILAGLEPSPRGVYTGAVGWVGPRRAHFAVAIRTLWRPVGGQLEYGVGGGIVWDSEAESEWNECSLKALVLNRQTAPFALLETMLYTPETGFQRLERHLARLGASAEPFGIPLSMEGVRETLAEAARGWTGSKRVRLMTDSSGCTSVEATDYSGPPATLTALIAEEPIQSGDPFLRHKTTYRAVYEDALAAAAPADECLLFNERAEATEFCNGNLVVRLDGVWVTPPADCGLLPGVLRQELIDSGQIMERVITLDDVRSAESVARINSLSGWVPIQLLDD